MSSAANNDPDVIIDDVEDEDEPEVSRNQRLREDLTYKEIERAKKGLTG